MLAPTPINLSSRDHQDMIHIVGLYKCGTSWLLHMLAAHPQVVGWREFDVLRATYARDSSLLALPRTALDYLNPRVEDSGWMHRQEAFSLRKADAIFREMFLGRGWVPVMGLKKQQRASALTPRNLDAMLEELLAIGDYRVRPASAPPIDPRSCTNRLGVQSFRRDDLLTLMEAVRDTPEPLQIPKLFFESLRSQVVPGSRIATKAADQLLQLSALKAASPGSRVIAIVRDGRDATVSAKHFEALMRKREAPWRTHHASFARRILGWSLRAAKLAEHARRGDITVLRYEDLHSNFAETSRALFLDLGLDGSVEVIDRVESTTNFSAVTDGRQPGEASEHQIRQGRVGEWEAALTTSQKRLAWRLAGKSLEAFGYTPSGQVEPSPLVLGNASDLSVI
ncbi:Sulfotransferase domain protein [Congregibacter litoralis KT71]|uniref:Sulfotransferase domain protein n=2 Tax=Congregibacter TaxID=393661 RepID=A4AD23_9GAMM|nr:Sulfotransferase domain protein [Congregibacter litoralis KT71]